MYWPLTEAVGPLYFHIVPCNRCFQTLYRPVSTRSLSSGRVQLKRDGTRWRMGGELKGKQANGVGSQYPSLPRNTVYPALLPLTRTPRLPVLDWTDAPADLNGLVRFAERQNMVSARVPSHFKRSLQICPCRKFSHITVAYFQHLGPQIWVTYCNLYLQFSIRYTKVGIKFYLNKNGFRSNTLVFYTSVFMCYKYLYFFNRS